MATEDACASCDRIGIPVSLCTGCLGMSYCDECWPKQPAHKANTTKLLPGRPHVKDDKTRILMIQSVMEPPTDPQEIRRLHDQDQDSRWFGVVRSSNRAKSQFHDFGRFDQLMADSRPVFGDDRYPKLVSFIGDTCRCPVHNPDAANGKVAGKSTIVKALVALGSLSLKDDTQESFSAPVPGSKANEGTATSEGVHLYADPEYLESMMPILYADCEGLNAGEKVPFAAEGVTPMAKVSNAGHKRLMKRFQPRERDLEWTNTGDPVRGTREFAVSNLYPRFLYTFSDVLVFVQKNPNQLHLTYKYLVDWARRNVEKSLNQAILPAAVVIINAAEVSEDSERWTIEGATDDFFRDVHGITAKDSSLKELMKNFTAEDDRRLLSARELLGCFYKSLRVIRIPAKKADTYSLINNQVVLLRDELISTCRNSFVEKRIKRRLANVDDLQEYLHAGFDHFASDIDKPFDFRAVSTRNKLIAHDFSDHILTLARTIYESTRREQLGPGALMSGLCTLIASCVLLDYVRNDLPGSVLEYFPEDYAPFCKTALQMFCNDFLPCEYRSKKIRYCCNVKSAHDKGHQNDKGKRELGAYRSSLNPTSYEAGWIQKVQKELIMQEQRFKNARRRNLPIQTETAAKASAKEQQITNSDDLRVVSRLHEEVLAEFFSQTRHPVDFISCVSCFRCLMATPEHALECGHVLCDSCIRDVGDELDDLVIIVRSCPLHRGKKAMHWEIAQKPDFAGLRILCLDGGGIRGIVELEVLRAIESCINLGLESGGVPVQRFFDLIVGTSTGGIVALGLAAKQWPVTSCITTFKDLCQQAFTERELSGTLFQKLVTLKHGSKWATTPQHDVLKKSFGEDLLFGGVSNVAKYAAKVAVVSTSGTGNRSLIMANYNRKETSDPGYTLETSHRLDEAFQIWEAAAATSAAPPYFKPFHRYSRTYLDGAINHNNPVVVAKRERRLLWPDVASRHPGVFLSLGTGQNASALQQKLRSLAGQSREAHLKAKSKSPKDDKKRYRAFRGVKNFFSVLSDKLDNVLDTEWAWQEFYRETVGEHWATEFGSRYIRLNPDLRRDPPPLDAKNQVNSLQREVRGILQQPSKLAEIQEVANMLIASSFYFKKEQSQICFEDGIRVFLCTGTIRCKLNSDDQYIKRLGAFLKNQIVGSFVPCFIVKPRLASKEEHKLELDAGQLDEMLTLKTFKLGHVLNIEVHDRDEPCWILLRLRQPGSKVHNIRAQDYPISGFPRKFMVENERNASRQQKWRREMLKRRDLNAETTAPALSRGGTLMSKFSALSTEDRVVRRPASNESLADSDTERGKDPLADQVWKEYKAWAE